MTTKLQARPKAEFRRREQCVLCGSTDLKTIWRASFADEFVRNQVKGSGYAGNPLSYLPATPFHRVRCQDCQMAFQKEILTETWLKTLYGQWITEQQIQTVEANKGILPFETSQHFLKHCLRLRSLLLNSVKRPPSANNPSAGNSPKLLDFGCGSGLFLRLSHDMGFHSVGIDFSESRQGQNRTLGESPLYANLDDLSNQPSAVGRFDAITLFQVLEHLAEPRATLQALAKFLKPGGLLIVEVPDCSSVRNVPANRDDYSKIDPLEHINHFTPESLSLMCQKSGFALLPHGAAYVTTRLEEVVSSWVGSLLRRSPFGTGRRTTSQYFCKS